jgi:hypothetical protein
MSGGVTHEHIAEVQWVEHETGRQEWTSRAVMVDWIQNKGVRAYVGDGRGWVAVGVVTTNPPYLRTHADGRPTDNLLALPRY